MRGPNSGSKGGGRLTKRGGVRVRRKGAGCGISQKRSWYPPHTKTFCLTRECHLLEMLVFRSPPWPESKCPR